MDRKNLITQLFISNQGKCSEEYVSKIKDKMNNLTEDDIIDLTSVEFKSPTTTLIISLLGGGLGLDRFYLGQTGKGILKLLTCGGFSIWAIIDLFLIMGATRETNTEKLISILTKKEKKYETMKKEANEPTEEAQNSANL